MNVLKITHTITFLHVSLIHLLGNRDEPRKSDGPNEVRDTDEQSKEICTEEQ